MFTERASCDVILSGMAAPFFFGPLFGPCGHEEKNPSSLGRSRSIAVIPRPPRSFVAQVVPPVASSAADLRLFL